MQVEGRRAESRVARVHEHVSRYLYRLEVHLSLTFLPRSHPFFRPPFSAAVARELNVAVYDILTLGKMVRPLDQLACLVPLDCTH